MITGRKFRVALAALLVGATALVGAGPAAADPHDDKARVDKQLAQVRSTYEAVSAQAQAALQAYNAATAQLPAAQSALAVTRGVVAARLADSKQADREAAAARLAADEAHQKYAGASEQVETARSQVTDFVVAAYKGSDLLTLDSLLESRSPTDLMDRLGYLDKSAQYEQKALDGYENARLVAGIANAVSGSAQQLADVAAHRAQGALDSAVAAQTQAEQEQAGVTALIDQQSQAMAAANSQRDATLAQYQALQQESDRIGAELRAQAGRSGASVASMRSGGHFLTPVHGWKSSDFGMRYDPYYKVWQLHAGVDLAAPEGSPIYAAGDGTVVQAGWSGGYGNYTCLYHGIYQSEGLSTCYGHQSVILVHSGQRVHRGDVIGRVGTTGASTGDHLHFEVRTNGTPVQPLDWLDSCLC